MMESRLNELLGYLHELSHVQASGHFVNEEIKEAIREVRKEIGFEIIQSDIKDSKRLIFVGSAGDSFENHMLWEAVMERKDGVIELPFGENIEAILHLCKLVPFVRFVTKDFKLSMSHQGVIHFDKTLKISGSGKIIVFDHGLHCAAGPNRIVKLV